jgi:hypothetical protein
MKAQYCCMPSERIKNLRKLGVALGPWAIMAFWFGLQAGGAQMKWIRVGFTIAASFCSLAAVAQIVNWYWHELLGWLWNRFASTENSNLGHYRNITGLPVTRTLL